MKCKIIIIRFIAAAIFVLIASLSALGQISKQNNSAAEGIEQDSLALVAFYHSTNGDNWMSNTNWLSNSLLHDWDHVLLFNGRVRSLYFDDNNLSGEVPKEIGDISELYCLELQKNSISGKIPSEIGNLINLNSLRLFDNQITGAIPPEVGNLDKLLSLDLRENQLTGSIPPEVGNMAWLRSLNLSRNQINGTIPPEIGKLSNLYSLVLRYNKISGSIPVELSDLQELIYLSLNNNQLTGLIPVDLNKNSKMGYLDLSNNNLEGSIPKEICNLNELSYLYLDHNGLSSEIPTEIGNLTDLIKLDLSSNFLEGPIPSEIGNSTNITHLNLNDNLLTGNIPSEIGNLVNLRILNLKNNGLSGNVPEELNALTNLDTLDLSNNKLNRLPEFGTQFKYCNILVQENRLTFEDLEPVIEICQNLIYSFQDSIGEEKDTTLVENSSFNYVVETGGSANIYQWYKDGIKLPLSGPVLIIPGFTKENAGQYVCRITSSLVPDLTLFTKPLNISCNPETFSLSQNYPNPFNPVTSIDFELPVSGKVKLTIYNILGQEITRLVDRNMQAGYHTVKWDASRVASGTYIYKIVAGEFTAVKKMVVIK